MKKRIKKKREKLALQYIKEHSDELFVRYRSPIAPRIETFTRKPIKLQTKIVLRHIPNKEFLYREFAYSLCENEVFRECIECRQVERHNVYSNNEEYIMSIDVLPIR